MYRFVSINNAIKFKLIVAEYDQQSLGDLNLRDQGGKKRGHEKP
jgi:hypothetical protein